MTGPVLVFKAASIVFQCVQTGDDFGDNVADTLVHFLAGSLLSVQAKKSVVLLSTTAVLPLWYFQQLRYTSVNLLPPVWTWPHSKHVYI